MGRKGLHYQFRKVFPLIPASATVQSYTSTPHPPSANTTKPFTHPALISSAPVVEETGFVRVDRRRKAKRLRRSVQRIIGVTAGLNWEISLIGYLILEAKHDNIAFSSVTVDSLQGALGCISVLQTTLIVYYWRVYLAYLEVLREAIQPEASAIPTLLSSQKELCVCTAECCFHLFVFYLYTNSSWDFEIFGTENDLSSYELCYLTVLLRNYHSLRLLYWYSPFSTLHTAARVSLVRATYRFAFVLRCFLVEYGLILVLSVYGVMVLIPSLFEYIFEHEVNENVLGDIWNNFWVVFYTQTTIGYGEGPPQTFFGQLMILISAVFGYFTLGLLNSLGTSKAALSLTECTLYSEIRYRHEKGHYLLEATVLIQRWWRLMTMRMRKKREVKVILGYFAQLRAYRSVLVSCTRVKDTRFERQITAFEGTVRPPLRSLQEYLSPVVEDRSLLIEVYRSAYNTKSKCSSLCKLTRKYAISRSQTPRTPSSTRTSITWDIVKQVGVRKSNQSQAKASQAAFQNLLSRLAEKSRAKSAPHREVPI